MDTEIARIIELLLDKHLTGSDICRDLGISSYRFDKLKREMKNQGINVVYNRSTKVYSLNDNKALTPDEVIIINRLEKMGLEKHQIDALIKAFATQEPLPTGPTVIEFSKKKIKFLLISDTHLGSKYYRPDILRHAAKYAEREQIDFVLNAGDTIEGVSGRADQWLELDKQNGLGLTEQIDYLTEQFAQFGNLKVYSIEAQGSHGGWAYASHRGSQGLNIGRTIEAFCPQYKFLGFDIADIKIAGITIRLRHPEMLQIEEYVNRLMPNNKPHVVIQGHFHGKVGYRPHRNVHCIDAGCMQIATPYLERKGAVPILGYWVVEITIGEAPSKTGQTLLKNGHYIEAIKTEFVQFYD